ncbi:hypothetical protein EVAR_97977_1 [Eumeta japonica]|uniref:Uncharacterized protein n=1 Tax=Eumeta variegata TaxID=151549 RepID=A0A4C1XEN0_EUMVA|nr:hypothetical protein EVAR_97977_1 [Eumeta japonica]
MTDPLNTGAHNERPINSFSTNSAKMKHKGKRHEFAAGPYITPIVRRGPLALGADIETVLGTFTGPLSRCIDTSFPVPGHLLHITYIALDETAGTSAPGGDKSRMFDR